LRPALTGTGLAYSLVEVSELTGKLKALDPAQLGTPGGFDVAKQVVDGREVQWTLEEFKNLPLLERVRMLSGGEVKFYSKGLEIPAREALKGL
jgi:hypothetical protein